MSANSSDSEMSLNDWTLVNQEGHIQDIVSEIESSSSTDFVTLETEDGAVGYHKKDDVKGTEKEQQDESCEQTERCEDVIDPDCEARLGGDEESDAIRSKVKCYEMPAEEVPVCEVIKPKHVDDDDDDDDNDGGIERDQGATVSMAQEDQDDIPGDAKVTESCTLNEVDSKIEENMSESEPEILTVPSLDDLALHSQDDKSEPEDREVEELTEMMMADNEMSDDSDDDDKDDTQHMDEDSELYKNNAAAQLFPIAVVPKYLRQDSCSSSDSDYVRIDPPRIPCEEVGACSTSIPCQGVGACVVCQGDVLTTSTGTNASTASSLSNFCFLPRKTPKVEGGDDPCDRPDSPDSIDDMIDDNECDSEVSIIDDYSSQAGDIPTKPGVRRYRHYRDDGLNNKLNWVVILVITAGIALGIGHFIGSSSESHQKKKVQEGQILRLKSLQNELLSCLEKDDALEDDVLGSEWINGMMDTDNEDDMTRYALNNPEETVDMETTQENPSFTSDDQIWQSSESQNDFENPSSDAGPDANIVNTLNRKADSVTHSDSEAIVEQYSEPVNADTQEEDRIYDSSEDIVASADVPVPQDRSEDDTPKSPTDTKNDILVSHTSKEDGTPMSQTATENQDIPVTVSCPSRDNVGLSANGDLEVPNVSSDKVTKPVELESFEATSESSDAVVIDIASDEVSREQQTNCEWSEPDTSEADNEITDGEIDPENTQQELAHEDTLAETLNSDTQSEMLNEDQDLLEDEPDIKTSNLTPEILSCQQRVKELEKDLSFAQGRADMWRRLFVNEQHKDSEGCSDDPALSFFTCINMFLSTVHINDAMKDLHETPLANFTDTVSQYYANTGDVVHNFTDSLRDQWKNVISFVQSEEFTSYVNASKEAVLSLNQMLKEQLHKVQNLSQSEHFEDMSNKTKSAWHSVSNKLTETWQQLKDYTISEPFKSKVTKVSESIQKTWQSVQNYSNKILHGEDTSSTFESVKDAVKKTMDSTWKGVKKTVEHVMKKGRKHKHNLHRHGDSSDSDSKGVKHKKRWMNNLRFSGEAKIDSYKEKLFDKETGEYRSKESKKAWMKEVRRIKEDGPTVVNGEYKAGKQHKRKWLKVLKFPGEERDTESWFDFWNNMDDESEDGSVDEVKNHKKVETVPEPKNRKTEEQAKKGPIKNKPKKTNNQERIRSDFSKCGLDFDDDDCDIHCHGNKLCLTKQLEDARKLYVELLHYRQWLKFHRYKKDVKELEEFLDDLEEFMDDPHPDDNDLEELQEDFEEVLEDMEKRAKKHNRKQQQEKEQQEKELQQIRQKSDKELKKESMEEELEVKDEKRQGTGHKKKSGDGTGKHARTKRREFHQEKVYRSENYERVNTNNQEINTYSTERNTDADWFFKRAEDRHEQRGHVPHWQSDFDPLDDWFFSRATKDRHDQRMGLTMWDMYQWFSQRYEQRAEWRKYDMDDQSNWFLRRP